MTGEHEVIVTRIEDGMRTPLWIYLDHPGPDHEALGDAVMSKLRGSALNARLTDEPSVVTVHLTGRVRDGVARRGDA